MAVFAFVLPSLAQGQAPVITSDDKVVGTWGQPFSYTITATNNPQSFSAANAYGELPRGLSLGQGGVVSGTPGEDAYMDVTVTATNSGGTGSKVVKFIIYHPQQPLVAQEPVPIEQSNLDPEYVLYLDFDGEQIAAHTSNNRWNNGNPFTVSHSGMSTIEMRRAIEAVKEDFLPFNIYVTTDPARYWNLAQYRSAQPRKRMRCIVTCTDEWLWNQMAFDQAVDGIAHRHSFRNAGATNGLGQVIDDPAVPCWAFMKQWSYPAISAPFSNTSGLDVAWAISHEVGHTLGLAHDGNASTEYWDGHGVPVPITGRIGSGNSSSFPIFRALMGHGSNLLSQWSRGEYANANNLEDDVAIIAATGPDTNGFGYAPDLIGDNAAAAEMLVSSGNRLTYSSFIGRTATGGEDHDWFRFDVVDALVSFVLKPAEPFTDSDPLEQQELNLGIANLFSIAWLHHPGGSYELFTRGALSPQVPDNPTTQQRLNPTEFLRSRITRTLGQGTYRLEVMPEGFGNPQTNGFSTYGNMGAYSITGIKLERPVFNSPNSTTATVGLPFNHPATVSPSATSFEALGLPPGLSIHSTTGVISGVPTAAGVYPATVKAFNSDTFEGQALSIFGQQTLTITVGASAAIAIATDNSLNWSTPNNYFGWFSQTNVTHDGVDAAQSGPIGHGQNAGMQIIVPGPGTISYWRKVDSEFDADFFIFTIDDIVMDQASGNENWVQKTFSVPAGSSKILRWSYRKDLSTNTGVDAAWVDQVVYTQVMPPVITSAGTLSAEQGTFISYPIIATNSPASYSIESGAVPGMSLNTSSGVFSGTPTVTGQFNITLGASNEAGTGVIGLVVTVTVSLADALDNTTQVFTRSGNGNWMGQQSISFIGGDSAQSADINDGQSCALQTTVAGPGNLSFWWKTDCEATNDYLICKDNGMEINGAGLGRISGNNNFTNVTYTVGSGSHTITWTYQKNGSVSVGADAGWVDGVAFGPAVPVITSPSSLAGPVGYPLNYDIVATNSPTSYDQTGALPPGMLFSPTIHLITGFPNQAGVWTVSVSATNGAGTASQTVTLYIQGSRVGWNLANNLTGANALALADPDGDGLVNLMEMALARDPNVRDNGFQPVDLDPMTNRLRARFRFNRRLADVTYYVETSPDLMTWTPIFTGSNFSWVTTPGTTLVDTFVSDMTYDLEVIDATAAGGAPRKFMRMRFVEQ